MPRLDNTRHEIFASSLAKGMSASAAYVTAGYKRNDGNASRLRWNEKVLGRVAELQDEAAGANRPETAKVMAKLAAMAFSDITEVVRWKGFVEEVAAPTDAGSESAAFRRSETRLQIVDADLLKPSTAAAIQEVSQSGDGSIRVKMFPKLPALLKLLDYLEAVENQRSEQPAPDADPESGEIIDFKAAHRRYRGLSGSE